MSFLTRRVRLAGSQEENRRCNRPAGRSRGLNDVRPDQREQLTLAHPRLEGKDDQLLHRILGALEDALILVAGEDR